MAIKTITADEATTKPQADKALALNVHLIKASPKVMEALKELKASVNMGRRVGCAFLNPQTANEDDVERVTKIVESEVFQEGQLYLMVVDPRYYGEDVQREPRALSPSSDELV